MSRRFLAAVGVLALASSLAALPAGSAAAASGSGAPLAPRPASAPRPAPAPLPTQPTKVAAPPSATDTARGSAATASTATPTSATGVTKVLVIQAYWTSPGRTSAAVAKREVITTPNSWYRRASYGRLGLTGSATGWVKVPKFKCGDFRIFPYAEAAARRVGYDYRRYSRVVVYAPCHYGSLLGEGQMPGHQVLLFAGGLTAKVAIHEQGHNYGLDHANYLGCLKNGKRVTFAAYSRCTIYQYYDITSDMGDLSTGDFSPPQKEALGWLYGHLHTVTRSETDHLAPYETTSGYKVLRIPALGHRYYWVAYHTRRGNDAHLPSGALGVIVHMSEPQPRGQYSSKSLVLDMVPLGPAASADHSRYLHLSIRPGESWTTPDGTQIHVNYQNSAGASVTITHHRTPRLAGAVTSLHAYPSDKAAILSFVRPDDGGMPVTYFRVQCSCGKSYNLADPTNNSVAHLVFPGLTNGHSYRFSIRAVTERGYGAARLSNYAKPFAHPQPAPRITSPRSGIVEKGSFHIYVKASTNSVTKSPIDCVYIHVVNPGGKDGGCDSYAPYVFTVRKGDFPKGTWTIEARSHDRNGNWSKFSAPVKFTVP